MGVDIRDALEKDEAEWRRLWTDHFDFHQVEIAPAVTDKTWKRILDPQSPISMRVAIIDSALAGYAIYFSHPSSWTMGDDGYLEDIYLDARFRGRGIGRALMEDLIALSRQRGWEHLYWHTDENNSGARKLYDQFTRADGFVRYVIKQR